MRIAVLLVIGALMLYGETPKPGLSELDREKLKRIQLQLELLRRQVAEAQTPIISEQSEILNRVCLAAELKRDECEVNIETGAVSKAIPKDEKK